FASGTLRLLALEGSVEGVDIEGDAAGSPASLLKEYLAPLTDEQPLTRGTLDHQVALIRQMPGVTTDIHIAPGSKNGKLRLVIKVVRKPIALTVNANNRGTELLGRTALVAHASAYNVTRGGEQLGLTLASATSTGRFRYAGADVSEAIGDEGGTL